MFRGTTPEFVPPVVGSVCVAHTLNLLIKDVTNCGYVKDTVMDAKKVVRCMRSHRMPRQWLRDNMCRVLLNPSDVRFGSHFIMVERLVEMKAKVRQVVVSQEWDEFLRGAARPIREEFTIVWDIVMCSDFWKRMECIKRVWEPMYRVLREFDARQAALWQLHFMWTAMEEEVTAIIYDDCFTADLREVVESALCARWAYLRTHTPAFMLARALHPQSAGGKKAPEDCAEALRHHIAEYQDAEVRGKLWAEWTTFDNGTGFLDFELTDSTMAKPLEWWNAQRYRFPHLHKLALSLLSCRGTSSECERSWKTLDHIVSVRRTRLGPDRAMKLVKLYHHFHARQCDRARRVNLSAERAGEVVVLAGEDGEAGAADDPAPARAAWDELGAAYVEDVPASVIPWNAEEDI